tara:strand:- start:64 stop:837 length:774 start_codon:yes stop_codon:yes gene_type:complete
MTKGIARRLNLQTGLGVSWSDNFKSQDGLIANRGQVIVHEVGVSCTCRSGDLRDAVLGASGNMNCTKCENGWLYKNPRQIMGLMSGISYQRQLNEEGFVSPGDCVLSVSPNLGSPPTDFDRITFTWPEPLGDGQIVIRGADAARNPLLNANEDLLNYAGAKLIYCEDEGGREYTDADFYFEGRKIVWNNPPIINTRYTIKYEGYVSWIVFSTPHSRRDRDISLGSRIILRKSHMVNLRTSLDITPVDKVKFGASVKA